MQFTPQQKMKFPTNNPPPLPQLLSQPTTNTNNKKTQPTYITEMPNYPTYSITSLECQYIQLQSRRTLNKRTPLVFSKDDDEEEVQEYIINHVDNHSPTSPKALNMLHSTRTAQPPPYPKSLNLQYPPYAS
jgi:hypothetical protein